MQISLHEVEGQTLRVGIRRGEKARPPLLLFNGIGANIELADRVQIAAASRQHGVGMSNTRQARRPRRDSFPLLRC